MGFLVGVLVGIVGSMLAIIVILEFILREKS